MLIWVDFGHCKVIETDTLCLIFHEDLSGLFHNDISGKTDIVYYLIKYVDMGNIWSLSSDLDRHTVLAISLRFFFSLFNPCINQALFIS